MLTGYAAFLDVLGFSALVSGEQGGRIERYLVCLKNVFDTQTERPMDYVVFSDSIILTTRDDSDKSLQSLLLRCSSFFGVMLDNEIALRGAIAHGPYISSTTPTGRFVAGRAIIDAYNFERFQDWVGIMLAPSVLQKVPDLENRCRYQEPGNLELLDELTSRMAWAAFVQRCYAIPFHPIHALERNYYQGFAIVPSNGSSDFATLRDSIFASLKKLEWLKSLAPNPQAQGKHSETIRWLDQIRSNWHTAAFRREYLSQPNRG
jgi:hypothetical protein